MVCNVRSTVLVLVILTVCKVQFCQTCEEGQYLDYNYCASCRHKCRTCTSNSHCNSCKEGYYLSNNDCIKCTWPCKSCSSAHTCDLCDDWYTLINNACIYCPNNNCDTCSSNQICAVCSDGYYLEQKKCHRCKSGCKTCVSFTQCDSCIQGYYLDGNNCVLCHMPCATCNTSTLCLSCVSGYYLNVNDATCTACLEQCSTCDTDTICTSCTTGYYLQGNMCTQCPGQCTSCNSAAYCTACTTGYYLQGNTCTQCPGHCTSCNSAAYCTACTTGYHRPNAMCCPEACSACSAHNDCTSCTTGYFMDHGQCKPCSDRCASCVSNSWCYDCKSEYKRTSGSCYICPDDCDECIGDNKCESCSDSNYYVHNHACVKCPGKCSRCTSNTECTYCTKGFYGTNQCLQECSDKCKDRDCEIDGQCNSCVDGMYGDNCNIECGQNCTRCDRSTGGCSSCEAGTYLNNYKCERCPTSCTQCTSSRCTVCVVGHWGGQCKKVCTQCKPETRCRKDNGYCEQSCVDGMYGKWCITRCSDQCLSCERYQPSRCTACIANKYGQHNRSSYYNCNNDCPHNCFNSTCGDKTGECTFGCKEGYHGNKCKCPQNCNCDTWDRCSSCKEGFGNVKQNCQCTHENCKDNDCSACTSLKYFVHDKVCCSCRVQDTNCEECTPHASGGFGRCIKCKTGFFPPSNQIFCTKCPTNCKDSTCDPITGECTLGCKAGHWDTTCNKKCAYLCLECDQHNGTCTVCQQGKYSPKCSKSCSPTCKTINHVLRCAINDGACIDGCRSTKVHGSHCQHSCSSNCSDEQCDWQTAHCLHGCTEHHYGNVCNNTCSQTCLTPKTGSRCYDTNGTCVDGCEVGYYGEMCENQCSPNCVNTTCEQFTGSCLHGCLGRFEGDNCMMALSQAGGLTGTIAGGVGGLIVLCLIVLLIVALIRRRRRHKGETGSSQEVVTYNDADDVDDAGDNCPVYAIPIKKKKSSSQINQPGEQSTTTNMALSTPHYKTPVASELIASDSLYANASVQKPARSKTPESSNDKTRVSVHYKADDARKSVPILEEELDDDIEPVAEDNDTYYNVSEVMKRKVTLDKLQQFVAKRTKQDFINEFQSLPVGLIKSYKIAKSGDNAGRNRYRGIYPYDDTLVVLKAENAGYMNANYIDGYRKNHAYIASMGPAVKFMKDISPFWKMIWQEKVSKIVMLTRLREAGTDKCDQYWPDKDFSETYGDILVTCQDELDFAEYVVRSFQISRKKEKRVLQQIHYTAWPDKGTPDDVTSLVEFRQKVNSIRTSLDGPVVVHCSAGIGRTGTYIALDILTNEGETDGSVDIFACVRNMREQRVNMVQTSGQYRYLHNAVVHTLTFDSKPIEATGFHDYMASHSNDVLGKKFLELQATIESRSEDETEAINRNKKQTEKNRPGADIPRDLDRPRLYLGIKQGTSDYINALLVNSYRRPKHFIMAQTPLANTVTDFLTLIVQEKCSLIINMDAEKNDDKDIGAYCPIKNEIVKSGSFTVKSSSTKHSDRYTQRELCIKHQQASRTDQVDVTHVQFSQWAQKLEIPQNSDQFLNFVKEMESLSDKLCRSGPVLVHCTTGAKRSGLFCVVSVLLEKIECNQEASIVNTVRQIKSKRHMAISSQEQFIFCHHCINEYLKSFDVYSNFATKI